MTEEEKDLEVKRLLLDWPQEDLLDLRSQCVEIVDSYDVGNCASRLLHIAEHELTDHHCAGSYLYLKAISKRLGWYHSEVQRKLEQMKKLETIQ